jgi:hypothetical protein
MSKREARSSGFLLLVWLGWVALLSKEDRPAGRHLCPQNP